MSTPVSCCSLNLTVYPVSEWARMLSWKGRFRDTGWTRPVRLSERFDDRAIRVQRRLPSSSQPMKSIRFYAFASLLIFATGVFAQTRDLSTSGEMLDRIAAVVNDGVVLSSQLDEQTEEITARLRQQNTELPPRNVLRKQIL